MGFAVPRRSGGYVAGVGRSIVAVDWSTQTMSSLAEVDEDKPNNRLNDGKVDPFGRLLAGQYGHLSACFLSEVVLPWSQFVVPQVQWRRR